MKIPPRHITGLVHSYQTQHNLKADGIYGPNTSESLEGYLAPRTKLSSPMRLAFDSALADVGEREDPLGSNMGPYVEGLRKESGLNKLGEGQWCAVFQSVHLNRAGVDIKHRRALGIVSLLEDLGSRVPFNSLRPGFCGLSLHRRGRTGHHVRIFIVYTGFGGARWVQYVGGNEKHRVVSRRLSLEEYGKDIIKVATVE